MGVRFGTSLTTLFLVLVRLMITSKLIELYVGLAVFSMFYDE